MKRYRLLTLVLCVALVGVNVVLVYSGERNKISDEFRERFVKNFQRTWLNTTEGDGMRPAETWTMVKAKRARKAETLKQPSLCLRLRVLHFYPD